MGKHENKKWEKIPVEKFVSKKKLKKIEELVNSNKQPTEKQDELEEILDDFTPKDIGTNRYIFLSKDDEYKNLIFKVAFESHGVEANFREFHNGDIDERLTKSYSIAKNGVFLVQEKVTPMNKATMEERKHDVRDMLKHLSKKLLLVDCSLTNFKNFGVRKNGDTCLLDHGDTVPLFDYQGDVVNSYEECLVSLRCKLNDLDSAKVKPCKGKLHYTKNYEFLECEKCGRKMPVHKAYGEFDGYMIAEASIDDDSDTDVTYKRWKRAINESREYAEKIMPDESDDEEDIIENCEINNIEETTEMSKTIINGKECFRCGGYWIPNECSKSIKWFAFKERKISPPDFLKFEGYDPELYKVNKDNNSEVFEKHRSDDTKKHFEPKKEEKPQKVEDMSDDDIRDVADMIIEKAISSGNQQYVITFAEAGIYRNKDLKRLRDVLNNNARVFKSMYYFEDDKQYNAKAKTIKVILDKNFFGKKDDSTNQVEVKTDIAEKENDRPVNVSVNERSKDSRFVNFANSVLIAKNYHDAISKNNNLRELKSEFAKMHAFKMNIDFTEIKEFTVKAKALIETLNELAGSNIIKPDTTDSYNIYAASNAVKTIFEELGIKCSCSNDEHQNIAFDFDANSKSILEIARNPFGGVKDISLITYAIYVALNENASDEQKKIIGLIPLMNAISEASDDDYEKYPVIDEIYDMVSDLYVSVYADHRIDTNNIDNGTLLNFVLNGFEEIIVDCDISLKEDIVNLFENETKFIPSWDNSNMIFKELKDAFKHTEVKKVEEPEEEETDFEEHDQDDDIGAFSTDLKSLLEDMHDFLDMCELDDNADELKERIDKFNSKYMS